MSITVGITTWPRYVERFEYLCMVVNSLRELLPSSTQQPLEWVVAAERRGVASHDIQVAFEHYCRELGVRLVFNDAEPCLGANMNNLLAACRTDFMLYVQDDFLLRNPLPLDADLKYITDHTDYGLVRYSWLVQQPDQQEPRLNNDEQPLRLLSPNASYYFSFHPFLCRVAYFTDVVGLFDPVPAAEWEMNVRAKEAAKEKEGAKVLARGTGLREPRHYPYFVHIGDRTSMTEKYADRVIRGRKQDPDSPEKYRQTFPTGPDFGNEIS